MKIRLNNKDTLQLTLAIKGGCIDTDKVECLKTLADNYNPPEQITDEMLEIDLKSLLIGWRLVPLTMSEWKNLVLNEWKDDEVKKEIYNVGIDEYYRRLVKSALMGLLALGALGSHRDDSDVSKPIKMLKLLFDFFKIVDFPPLYQ